MISTKVSVKWITKQGQSSHINFRTNHCNHNSPICLCKKHNPSNQIIVVISQCYSHSTKTVTPNQLSILSLIIVLVWLRVVVVATTIVALLICTMSNAEEIWIDAVLVRLKPKDLCCYHQVGVEEFLHCTCVLENTNPFLEEAVTADDNNGAVAVVAICTKLVALYDVVVSFGVELILVNNLEKQCSLVSSSSN